MSEIDSGLSRARSPARLFRAWTQWAGVLALFPVVRIWQITGDTDTAVTTLALFVGAAWQIQHLLPQVRHQPRPLTRQVAVGLLVTVLWQLAWIGPDDFWFLRLALVLWGGLWLVSVWGLAGLVWGWRVLAAFVLWAIFCDAPWRWTRHADSFGDDSVMRLAILTAKLSGWLLAQGGATVVVSGNILRLGDHAVSVGGPCTALPLAKLLLLLLAFATLLFRLEIWPAIRLAIVTALISFLISIGRVMLLAAVVGNPPSFHYWHDPEQGGTGWFTAVGMLIMGFLVTRQVFRQMGSGVAPPVPLTFPASPPVGWFLMATLAGLAISLWPTSGDPLASIHPAQVTGFNLVQDRIQTNFAPTHQRSAPDEAASVRHLTYQGNNGGSQVEFVIAYIPQTLTGNPLDHPLLNAQVPAAGPWHLSPDRRYAWCQSPAGSAWTTTLAQDGTLVVTDQDWTAHLHQVVRRPSRWLAWLTHQAPLRDKRSFWIAASTSRPSPTNPPPQLFIDWIAVLSKSR